MGRNGNREISAGNRQELTEVMESEFTEYLQTPTLDAIFFCNFDGNILNANRQTLELFNYSESEFLTVNFCDLRSSYELASTKALLEHVLTCGAIGVEIDLKKRTGTTFIGQMTLIHSHVDGKDIIKGVVHQTIERNCIASALRNERDRAQMYLDAAGYMFVTLDSSGSITMLNPKACEVLECLQQDYLGKNWFDSFVPPRQRSEVSIVFEKLMKGDLEPVESFVNPVITSKGNKRIISWHNTLLTDDLGKIIGTFSSGEDITNQHLAKKAIKEQRDFLELAIESLTHPFYVIDANTYRITMANKAANLGHIDETSTCYSLTHRRNEPCSGIEHPCPLQEVKLTKKPVIVKHMHYNDAGDMRYLEVHAYPIFDSSGNVTQMIEYDLDVTEQKRIEKQLEIESRRARLYLDLLAHDVTNQLQIIWSCAELINGIPIHSESHETLSRFLNHIEDSVKKCRSMIVRARLTEQLPLTPLIEMDLKKVIYECIETVAEKQDEFNALITIDVVEARILADKFLEDLLECLIENAVKHNPKDKKKIWISLKQERAGYEIQVADNGLGLKDSIKKRIFNPLHRFGGIGLHISSEITEKYGGELRVRDRVAGQPNFGAEFILWLPKIGSTRL
ncbi:MAG: PAS domain S-box protein [Candidatus Thorarchaeota archaeon]